MKITSFNIVNFRRLHQVTIDVAEEKTIFVGANNSGKTSASYALKYFLSQDGKKHLQINDITLSNHQKINEIGELWIQYSKQQDNETITNDDIKKSYQDFTNYFPYLDILMDVPKEEVHHIIKIIPSLDWQAGLLGIRLCYEAIDLENLVQDYVKARKLVEDKIDITLWPSNLIDFLSLKMSTYFKINTYLLDLDATNKTIKKKSNFVVQGFSIHELIKFDFIAAQREISDDIDKTSDIEKPATQIRRYYDTIINPEKSPNDKDHDTIRTMQQAQLSFNTTLESELKDLFTELKNLGYPNLSDPDIEIKTKIGLLSTYINHASVLNYKTNGLSLPENYLGLGC